jgi:hypothetical protein
MQLLYVFSHLDTEIVGSNPTRGSDVSVYSVFVLSCVGVYSIHNCIIISEWERAKARNLARQKKKKIIKTTMNFSFIISEY